MRIRIQLIAFALVLLVPAGLGAATAPRQGPQPIYSAFTLTRQGAERTRTCGAYQVRTATYAGTAVSPDARMAGAARYASTIIATKGRRNGIANGTLTIRDLRGRLRHRTTVRGVLAEQAVNGLVSGSLYGPNASILANVTIVFDDGAFRATFRLGMDSGANSGLAYPTPPRCR